MKAYSKGRVTNLWKEQERTDSYIQGVKLKDQAKVGSRSRIRGSNGTYLEIGDYLGTKLYINVTVYDPPIIAVKGSEYQVPQRIRIECYEKLRGAIGQNRWGNLAIVENQMDELKKDLIGKKVGIRFEFSDSQENNSENHIFGIALLSLEIEGEYRFYGNIYAEKIIRI